MSLSQISDVDKAVAAAKEAFEEGEWGKMNPRDRGRLIYKSVHFSFNTHVACKLHMVVFLCHCANK